MRLLILTLITAAMGLAQTVTPDVYPQVISKIEPEYTEEARRAGVNANASVRLIVSADGIPENVEIVRGPGFGLDENAVAAVKTWRFNPGTKNGVPAPVRANVEVQFRLLDGSHAGQSARLTFALPAGASRPKLIEGIMPLNPPAPRPAARLRATFSVGIDGVPKNVAVETADPGLEDAEILQIRGWRFQMAEAPVEVPATFELNWTPIQTGAVSGNQLLGTGAGIPMVPLSETDPLDATLVPPELTSPADDSVFDNFPRTTVFQWEPSPEAATYIVQVEYQDTGGWHNVPAGFAVKGTQFTHDFVGAQPGRWRVWPVNAGGVRGSPSPWRTFRYTR